MNFKDKINFSKDEINFVEKIDRIRQGISDRKNEDSDTVSKSVRNRNRSENRCNILIIRNELAKKSNDLTIIRKTFVAHAQNHLESPLCTNGKMFPISRIVSTTKTIHRNNSGWFLIKTGCNLYLHFICFVTLRQNQLDASYDLSVRHEDVVPIMHTRILCNSIYACTHSCTNAWPIRGIDRQPFWNSLLSTRGSNSPSSSRATLLPPRVLKGDWLSSILPFFAERRTGWARRGGTKRSSTSIARELTTTTTLLASISSRLSTSDGFTGRASPSKIKLTEFG